MGVCVLLIDDSQVDRELTRHALERLPTPPGPVELVYAFDWTEAAPRLADSEVDLILLDFHLPGLSGLEILPKLQELPHPPPVIMLTGQSDIATAVETLRMGAHDYVTKEAMWGPSLRLAVERVLDRVRLERELAQSRAQLAAYAAELEEKVSARTATVEAQAAEIERLYLRGEEAARLRAEILANVSHELRTPLHTVIGYTDLLQDELSQNPSAQVREMLGKLRSEADRLGRAVGALLAVSSSAAAREGVELSRFTLGELLEDLRADALGLNADKGLAIAWAVESATRAVRNDREKIRAIAYHLLSNAIKFTHAGKVEVQVSSLPDNGLRLRVRDTGIGLPHEAREAIFDDFRQLDGSRTRHYEGLGLGLSIVKRYTALLRGTVQIESAPGAGTTVSIEIPGRLRARRGRRAGSAAHAARTGHRHSKSHAT